MTVALGEGSEYGHGFDEATSDGYLYPTLLKVIRQRQPTATRCFDLGAGNGGIAARLSQAGFEVVGVEPSPEGVAIANKKYPELKISVGSGYDTLSETYGTFPIVYSIEVIEHVYSPRVFIKNMYDLTAPGGTMVLSTPYHGYWKNFLMAATGKMDDHFTALWDHGHIKFWSHNTISKLINEITPSKVDFDHAGRIYPFSKSMFAVVNKPG